MRPACLAPLLSLMLFVSGCSTSYVTPGRAASLSTFGLTAETKAQLTESSIREILERRPLASFPVSVAVVRVQGSGYRSYTAEGYGEGAYSVVLDRDVEDEEDLERLAAMPGVRATAALGRLLLPETLQSDLELRRAAAALRTEMMVIYTLDTRFTVEDRAVPLTVISLGFLPSKQATVRTTAAALLVDVRNGYLYGIAEATRKRKERTNSWTSRAAIDRTRREVEGEAFGALVDEIESMWGHVVEEARNAPPSVRRDPALRSGPRRTGPATGRWYPTDGG